MIPQEFINKFIDSLDTKKPQTTYKIEYVSQYVEEWLYVVTNVDDNKNINFIDCMCNAGIYSDGDKGTAIKVLELYNEFSKIHQDKTFNLILNDIDSQRLKIMQEVVDKFEGITASNIHIYYNNMDVNAFLANENYFNHFFNCYPKRSANLVFVDPYNFCTVKISILEQFLQKFYCELIYNIFTSDYVRNQDKDKMKLFCAQEGISEHSKKEMVELRNHFTNHVYRMIFDI